MSLTGTLNDLSLPNLVQLQCSEQAHAQVTLTHENSKGVLIFANGELISASVDDKVGEDAVYHLLTWEEGTFRVDNESISAERNVDVPWSALLLEGLRLADEARAERDSAIEGNLKDLRGKQGLRSAVVTNMAGVVRANAKDKNLAQDAAMVAFVAGCGMTVGLTLNLGAFTGVTTANANEKIVIEKLENNHYLGCWLEPRTTPEQIQAILMAVGVK